MTFLKMCSSFDTYFAYVSRNKSLSSDKDIVDLIIENDLMYHNDYIQRPLYKQVQKYLVNLLKKKS